MTKVSPKIVYKFRPWDVDEEDDPFIFSRKIFQNLQIYFANPSEFNDPFDVTGDYNYLLLSQNEWIQWLKIQMEDLRQKGQKDEEIQRHYQRLTNPLYPIWENRYEVEELSSKLVNGFRSIIGIFSTSARSIHPLLWAHYANKHKGICIGFDANLLSDSTSAYGPVKYSQGFRINSIKPDIDKDISGIINLLTSKSHFWKYEKEIRFFDFYKEGKSRLKSIHPEAIKEVIFGCQMDMNMKRRTYEFIKDLGYFDHVKFYSAHKVPGYYLVRTRPLDTKFWY